MAWATSDIPDLSGKTAVVTGANAGLGLETARGLAGAGCHVVMAARNREKAGDALTELTAVHTHASLEIIELDLASLRSIEAAALAVFSNHPTLDILVNNAGLMAMPEGRTDDGFEMQFGVNHLGHWALTARLLPALLGGPGGAGGDRHQHCPSFWKAGRSRQSPTRRRIRPLESLRPIQARQLSLCHRAATTVRGRRTACRKPRGPSGTVEHRSAGQHGSPGWGEWLSRVLAQPGAADGDDSCRRRPSSASSCDRPQSKGRPDVRPQIHQLRCCGTQTDLALVRDVGVDPGALGCVRTGDRAVD